MRHESAKAVVILVCELSKIDSGRIRCSVICSLRFGIYFSARPINRSAILLFIFQSPSFKVSGATVYIVTAYFRLVPWTCHVQKEHISRNLFAFMVFPIPQVLYCGVYVVCQVIVTKFDFGIKGDRYLVQGVP